MRPGAGSPGAGSGASRARALFDGALAGLAAALVATLLAVVAAGVAARGLNRPLAWTDELSGFLMVWLASAGWMLATRRGVHIRIRIAQDRLPPLPWRALEIAIQLAVIVFGLVVAWRAALLAENNWDVEAVSMPIATAWLYLPLIPAGLLTAAQGALDLVRARKDAPAEEALL